MPRYFRVLTNHHAHNDGKSYKKGSIVTSETDLCEVFPNKFKEVNKPDNLEKRNAKLTGPHNLHPVAPQAQPAVDHTDPQTGENPTAGSKTTVPVPDSSKKQAKKAVEALGDDLTEKFPLAVQGDLKVFGKKAGNKSNYFVTTAEDQGTALHEEPFTTMAEVKAWLTERDEEQDELDDELDGEEDDEEEDDDDEE